MAFRIPPSRQVQVPILNGLEQLVHVFGGFHSGFIFVTEMLPIILIQLFALLLLVFLYMYRKRYCFPPGPKKVSSSWSMLYITFQKWASLYGPIVYAHFGFQGTIIIDDPKLLRQAFNNPAFAGREFSRDLSITTGGHTGIVFMNPPAAFEVRHAILKSIRSVGMGRTTVENLILNEVKELVEWINVNEGQPINLSERLCIAASNPILMLLTKHRFAHDDLTVRKTNTDANNAILQLTQSRSIFTFPPFLYNILPERLLVKYYEARVMAAPYYQLISDVLRSRIRKPDASDPNDVIGGLLAIIKETTDPNSQLYSQRGVETLTPMLSQLYGAAQAMIPMLFSWMILLLVRFDKVQRKLHKELDEVVGNKKFPSLAHKIRLPYAQAVCTEILRYSSVSPLALPHKTLMDSRLGGYDIRKGTQVFGNLYSIHHSVQLWGDPENFRPERFLSLNSESLTNTHNVMPFGTGKRGCLGETLTRDILFIFLTTICQRFYLLLDSTNPTPPLEPLESGFFRIPQQFNAVFRSRRV